MLDKFKDFLDQENNSNLVIIIASILILLIIVVFILFIFKAKKKKYRRSLDSLRLKIQNLKQHEVIKNYSSYDNLKNDQKLGILILRWKKEIEKLVREIDAQYSMLDVLEDAIDQNNYQYFISLKESFYKDIKDLEQKADKFKNEVVEYIDMASDNRKYVSKYYDMVNELKEQFNKNIHLYETNQDQVEAYFTSIENKFIKCQHYIDKSAFVDADNIASNIFKDIKVLENYIENSPKILEKISANLLPKFSKIKKMSANFTEKEMNLMNIKFDEDYQIYYGKLKNIICEINSFSINDFESDLTEIDEFLVKLCDKLEYGSDNKNYILNQIHLQKDNIKKIENTGKNFVSIFKVVNGSYNITESEINLIEQMIINTEEIHIRLSSLIRQFDTLELTYEEIKQQLGQISSEISKITKELDKNLIIIDDIYKDEKNAREEITIMTEKINGTKKYIKFANLDEQDKYLKIIRSLSLELNSLYLLIGSFPIDIIKLNESLKILVNKVEKTTRDINSKVYKMLLAEFVLIYANRYFYNSEYQKNLIIAEDLFYNHNYSKAYDKAMSVLESISPLNKQIILNKYQEKFSEIFN